MSSTIAIGAAAAAAGVWWLSQQEQKKINPNYGGNLSKGLNSQEEQANVPVCPDGTVYRDGRCWPPGNPCEEANGPGWTLSPDGKFCNPPPSLPGQEYNPCNPDNTEPAMWQLNKETNRCVPAPGVNPCAAPPLGPEYTYREEENDEGEMVGKCFAPDRPPQCPNGYVWRRDDRGEERCMRGNPLDIGLSSLPIYGAVAAEIALSYVAGSAIEAGGRAAYRGVQAAGAAVNPGAAAARQAAIAQREAARAAATAQASARASRIAQAGQRAAMRLRRMVGTPLGLIFMGIAQILIAVLGLHPDEFELCRSGEFDVASLPDWARILIESIPFAGDLFSMIGPTICISTGCVPPNVEQNGLCYPPPRENFWCEGPLCYSQHPQWQNNGQLHTTTHITKNIKMDTGTIPNHCPPGSRLDGVLCYNLPSWANGHITGRSQEVDVDAYLNANADLRERFTVNGAIDRAAVIAFANGPDNGARHVPRNEVRTYNTTGTDVSILAGVAWQNCPAGHHDTGTRCERVHGGGVGVQRECPPGFHPDGVTCRREPRDYAHPCPGYVPNPVGCCLCERPARGGNCDPPRWDGRCTYWGLGNWGGCHRPGHCHPVVLGDTRARRIDHTPLKVLAAGLGSTLPCPAGREVGHDGLCYTACGPGYRREGLLCTQSFDKRSEVLAPFSPSCPPGRIDGAPFGSAGLCYRGDMPAGYRRVVAGTIEQYCPTVPPEWGPIVENVLDIGVACQRARYERGVGQVPMGIRVKARRPEIGPPPVPPSCEERNAIFGALDEAGRDAHVAQLCIKEPCGDDETMDATASFCVADCRKGYRKISRPDENPENPPNEYCIKDADATGPASEYRNRPPRTLKFD